MFSVGEFRDLRGKIIPAQLQVSFSMLFVRYSSQLRRHQHSLRGWINSELILRSEDPQRTMTLAWFLLAYLSDWHNPLML